jgi:hypothetical protein
MFVGCAKFGKEILGVPSGFDRVLFRGYTARLWNRFRRQNLPEKYVYGEDDKEKIARAFAAERGIAEGNVCA